MLNKPAASLLLLLLTGCDVIDHQQPPPKPAEAAPAPLKWAKVDRYKISSTIKNALQQASANAAHQGDETIQQTRDALRQQINALQQAFQKKCVDMATTDSQTPAADSAKLMKACLKKQSDDSEISTLIAQFNKSLADERAIWGQDSRFYPQADKLLKPVMDSYAAQHDYTLIISDNSHSFLYNQDQVALDITAEVLEFLKQNPSLLDNPPELPAER
jgi:Skp family chaperone for outer membrane proteins